MPHALLFQQRLQLVLKFFFAQRIQPVARNSAQHGMHNSSRRLAIARIKKRPQQGHQKHQAAPCEARNKCLAVPGKEGDRPDGRQLQQTPFHPPVHRRRGPRPGRQSRWNASRRMPPAPKSAARKKAPRRRPASFVPGLRNWRVVPRIRVRRFCAPWAFSGGTISPRAHVESLF